MTDDPRKILKAAGLELEILDDYEEDFDLGIYDDADTIILELAKLVARYKWKSEHRIVYEQIGKNASTIAVPLRYQEIAEMEELWEAFVKENYE
jgi:hypothetical protein